MEFSKLIFYEDYNKLNDLVKNGVIKSVLFRDVFIDDNIRIYCMIIKTEEGYNMHFETDDEYYKQIAKHIFVNKPSESLTKIQKNRLNRRKKWFSHQTQILESNLMNDRVIIEAGTKWFKEHYPTIFKIPVSA